MVPEGGGTDAHEATLTVVSVLLLTALWLPGCSRPTSTPETLDGDTPPSETATTPPETTPAEDGIPVRVYFVRNEAVAAGTRIIPRTTAVAKTAIEQLLLGPTTEDAALGMSSAIPAGTSLHGVTVKDGLATVDLSREFKSGGGSLSMQLRAAQIVYTLTQFPTIESVAFETDGEPLDALGGEGLELSPPVGRTDFENVTPAILVESPTPGGSLASPVRLTGTANVFEALFVVTVTAPNGEIVTEQAVQATSGTGTRGTFDALVEFDVGSKGPGTITVYEPSAKDGTPTNIVSIPSSSSPRHSA